MGAPSGVSTGPPDQSQRRRHAARPAGQSPAAGASPLARSRWVATRRVEVRHRDGYPRTTDATSAAELQPYAAVHLGSRGACVQACVTRFELCGVTAATRNWTQADISQELGRPGRELDVRRVAHVWQVHE